MSGTPLARADNQIQLLPRSTDGATTRYVGLGLPYNGAAPDLGAFEVPEPSSAAEILILLVTLATRRRRDYVKHA